MRSDYDENLLLAYVEGELSNSDRQTVEGWIAADPQLRVLVEGMTADRQAIRRAPQPEPPAWIMEEVDRKLERSMLLDTGIAEDKSNAEHHRHVLRRLGWVTSIAALLLITAGVVLWSIVGLPTGNDTLGTAGSVAMDRQSEPPPPAATPPSAKSAPQIAPLTALNTPLTLKESAKPAPQETITRQEKVADAAEIATPGADAPVASLTLKAPPQLAVVEPTPPAVPSQIIIHTQDLPLTVQQLKDLAAQIDHAQLIPDADASKYSLRIPPDQLSTIITQLQNAAGDFQRVELITGESPVAQQPLDEPRLESLRRNWPSFAPDYRNILRQQLPLESQDGSAQPSTPTILIPITLRESQSPTPPPTEP